MASSAENSEAWSQTRAGGGDVQGMGCLDPARCRVLEFDTSTITTSLAAPTNPAWQLGSRTSA